ncbi:epidermal growth factor receptor kinase substrate 8-like isoform X6 [Littorina saxatilis]|uniref:SH3 domain-containing protein n=1 Tax=Littorina saxatilis TaxID=31220 RepID=A0AAN9G868_9CAEN
MPGLNPGEMTDYGRYAGPDHGYTNGHFNDHYSSRDDAYREDMRGDEDPYRRQVRNGNGRAAYDRFNDPLADQSSLSDFNSSEPAFELDHLATFAAGTARKGKMNVEDGLRKLRQMENTTGIWTMRCILLVERRFIVILDKNSGEELERFPVHHLHEPTAIFKNDRREIYNNLILFTVMDESNKKDAQADMHIFQSVRTPAQNIVDEIFAAKRGTARISGGGYKIPPPPSGPAPEPPGTGRDPYDFGGFRETIEQRQYSQFNVSQYGASQFNNGGNFLGGAQRTSMMARPSYLPYREREDEVGSNELLERDVQLLNHCFDDIEKFVARLQQAAEAYKELERRRRERGAKGKKVASGDGMLGQRARPPPANDFIDIFQKFKLSFNLLAKLKAHIHDPNAPELVHFLFTPLSLIYEASRDPIHGNMNLGEQAVAPVLTQDAKQLLLNCLTSKEIELWQALGKNWTTSKDEWKGHCPAYVPKFYDGWQPAPTLVDEPTTSRSNFQAPMDPPHMQSRVIQHEVQQNYVPVRPMPFPDEDPYNHRERIPDYQRERIHDFERAPTPTRNMGMQNNSSAAYNHYEEKSRPRAPEPVQPSPPQQRPIIDDNSAYLEELRRTGGSIYIVNHDRQGKNSKELSVHKGDVLQVLDNNRNWWKVRNYKGETGYCPYTILRAADATDNGRDGGSALNTSAEQAAGHSRKTSSRDTSTLSEPPLEVRRKESREGPPSSRFEEIRIPPLGMGEEEEEERHAFRPVEPAALYANKGAFGMRKNQPQDDLHNELRTKMGIGALQRRGGGLEMHHNPENTSFESHGSGGAMGQQFYITADSSQHDVTAWLEMKGFTTLCVQMLKGYTGRDMFALHRHEMEQLLGHEEATRLEGQVTLQKKMTGYKTQSAAELNAIFHKRRARTDQQGAQLGQPPGFRPLSPSNSYDGQDSDSDNDDRHLADTGKTLRDLLIRQRQKISGAGVFDQQ